MYRPATIHMMPKSQGNPTMRARCQMGMYMEFMVAGLFIDILVNVVLRT